MRRFFEAVAHALRARRELATAAAVAIIAAALIIIGRTRPGRRRPHHRRPGRPGRHCHRRRGRPDGRLRREEPPGGAGTAPPDR